MRRRRSKNYFKHDDIHSTLIVILCNVDVANIPYSSLDALKCSSRSAIHRLTS